MQVATITAILSSVLVARRQRLLIPTFTFAAVVTLLSLLLVDRFGPVGDAVSYINSAMSMLESGWTLNPPGQPTGKALHIWIIGGALALTADT